MGIEETNHQCGDDLATRGGEAQGGLLVEGAGPGQGCDLAQAVPHRYSAVDS